MTGHRNTVCKACDKWHGRGLHAVTSLTGGSRTRGTPGQWPPSLTERGDRLGCQRLPPRLWCVPAELQVTACSHVQTIQRRTRHVSSSSGTLADLRARQAEAEGPSSRTSGGHGSLSPPSVGFWRCVGPLLHLTVSARRPFGTSVLC